MVARRTADTTLKQFAKRPIVDRTIAEAQHGELYSGAADGDLRPMQYVPAVEKLHDSGFYFCWSIVRKDDRCDMAATLHPRDCDWLAGAEGRNLTANKLTQSATPVPVR